MGWFDKSRLQIEHDLSDKNSKVEVVTHKKATKREIAKVKEVNQSLNDLFITNGFTLKIYLAKGGKHSNTKGQN